MMDPIDKSWMFNDINGTPYRAGVDFFMEYAVRHWKRTHKDDGEAIRIPCPCRKCENDYSRKLSKVKFHLISNGINPKYTKWTKHGEKDAPQNCGDGDGNGKGGRYTNEDDGDCVTEGIPTDAADTRHMVEQLADAENLPDKKLVQLMKDAEQPLYENCSKFTRLSSMCKLFNLKSKYGASDGFFDELLPLLKEMLPPDNALVKSTYEAKKAMKALGSGYEKIHVCINDCILYRNDYADRDTCPTCGESRWKVDKETGEVYVNIPAKTMWYFPIIPRLQAYYLSEKTCEAFLWHHKGRKKDGVMRHPADSPAWKVIDDKYPEFASEPRHLRLGISADGVDVNNGMHGHRSVWPVLTVIYNLPPWLCMKRKFTMLSVLIEGGPGKNIDVMLEPYVQDLKLLFEKGVECFDAYNQEDFNLKAVVLWTINDYPALGTLCGCTYSGRRACVVCGEDTSYVRLKNSGKEVYTGHRRYLPYDHPFRYQKKGFNGQEEHNGPAEPKTGEQIYETVRTIQNSWGKGRKDIEVEIVQKRPGRGGKIKLKRIQKTISAPKLKSTRGEDPYWKKFSIWFLLLPYWRYLPVHHCIDFMHVEKNVCDSLVGTFLNIEKKTKDHLNARLDLADQGVKPELQPKPNDKGSGFILPAASTTLTPEEKDKLCGTLAGIRAPQGYCSNFSTLVSREDRKLIGLKSHDCHMLMQQFLPVAIKSIMPTPTRYAVIRFCFFFRAISSKEIKVEELDELQKDLCVTLCLLEKYFPPSFFDIMVHLTVHLTREVKLCGPICYRWMYPFERYMKVIKGHVRNHNRPGGSIAEGNVVEETLEMLSEYQKGMKTVGIPNDGENISLEGKAISGRKLIDVNDELWMKAHVYVLRNTEGIQPYISQHVDFLRRKFPKKGEGWLEKQHCETFGEWFKLEVEKKLADSRESVPESLRWLSKYPGTDVMQYDSYRINGYLFRTKSHEGTVYQNSGVYVQATDTNIRKSGKTLDLADYYGVLQEIWVLNYHDRRIALFMCDWVDNKRKAVSTDRIGFTLVELDKLDRKDPFILASQAKQVFYVADQENKKKSIVLMAPPTNYKDAYDCVDEEFSTVTINRSDFDLPPVDPRELGKESWDNCARPDIRGRVVRPSKG